MVARFDRGFAQAVPHNRALGMRIVELDAGGCTSELPYDPRLVGDPESGVLHGGAITALMDATCGAAIFLAMGRPVRIATLDLRIDYLKRAAPGRAVHCHASCYKRTRSVAFTRAIAHLGDADDPIASAVGSFMIFPGQKSALEVFAPSAEVEP
ncbi:MAG: PaaI family thioesterase [Deltaproteobacteria bacterium]|nr:PaaI family thioesterase [Deltaproteobacteria bacterium]